MRKLTQYELMVLIKNEISLLYNASIESKGLNFYYTRERARDILTYIEEAKIDEEN